MMPFALPVLLLLLALAVTLLLRRIRRARAAPSVPPAVAAVHWPRVQELILAALARPPAGREEYLRAECANDGELFEEVMSLVSASERAGVLDDLAETVVRPLLEGDAIRTGEVIGRYRIAEKLGQGGMGVVYRAHDMRLDRTVALKFLPHYASTDTDAKQRFINEARAAAALDHPNVCTIHEIGETEQGALFIAMPHYQGETLRGRLARGALPIADAVTLAMQVARGLAKAHERGIVHRDVKPANIVVTEDGVAKILDFGVAKLASSSVTRAGTQPGTVAYMSPEQAAGDAVDQRCDIWALGVVLHEMLVGSHPFGGGTGVAMLHSILTRDAAAPSRTRPDVPAELDAIVQRALARDMAARYADIREMAGDLEECAARGLLVDQARVRAAAPHPAALLPAEGERRSVTVLVSSLAASSDALDRLTATHADTVMHALRDIAQRIMTAHGGVVNEVTSETVVCLFGVPEAHEDDYVRCVRAAVDLHAAAAGLETGPILLQSGVDAGPVLARPSDAPDRAFRVAGDPLRTATLLSTLAAPGAILVSPRSQRLIAPYYLTQALEPIAGLRGETRFVPHRVLGKSGFESRLEAASPHGLTRYTGRDQELRALQDRLATMLRGQGAAVGVVGEAGLGKSRLLHEFRRGIDPATVDVVVGRCHSHDSHTPYRPFAPIVLRALGLDLERGDELAANVIAAVQQNMPELTYLIPLCLQVLALSSEQWPLPRDLRGANLRAATGEAIATLLTAAADRKPLVVLLEDWHWADDASREALDPLIALVGSHRLLIGVTYRPDITLDFGRSSQYATLRLEPLDDHATTAIMCSALNADTIAPRFAAAIHERTGGNPFFIEELCRALTEQDVLRIEDGAVVLQGDPLPQHLPETVQFVIRTRLDRLDRASRDLLGLASVIGREFDRNLLAALTDNTAALAPSLARLRDAGLIQTLRLLPDAAYRFKHALTQEVAYNSLPEPRSRMLHLRVGEALEGAFAQSGEASLALLCDHFAAAQAWSKAISYARLAAGQSSRLSGDADAKEQLDRALAWLDQLPLDQERERLHVEILLDSERLVHSMGRRDIQRRILNQLIDCLEPAGDDTALAEVYTRIGDLHTTTGNYVEAEDALGRALRMALRLDSAAAEAAARRSLGFLRWHQGRNEEAQALLEQTLDLARREDDVSALAGDLTSLAAVTSQLGHHAAAIAHVEKAIEICSRENLPLTRILALIRLAFIHRDMGDIDRSFAFIHDAHEMGRRHGLFFIHSWTGSTIAEEHLRRGDVDACIAAFEDAIEASRRKGEGISLAVSLRGYGFTLHGLGRHADAVAPLREAVTLLERAEKHDDAARIAEVLARALEELSQDQDALDVWHRLRAHGRRSADGPGELTALEGIARIQRRMRTSATSLVAALEEAVVLAERLGDHARQGRILNTLGIIEFEQTSVTAAMTHFQRAHSAFERTGDAANAAQMMGCIAACMARSGDHAAAIVQFEAAIAGLREEGQNRLQAQVLGALGDVHATRADFSRAAECYEESLRIRREVGDRVGEGWMLLSLGRAAAQNGQHDQSVQYWSQAQSIASECASDELCAALTACTGQLVT